MVQELWQILSNIKARLEVCMSIVAKIIQIKINLSIYKNGENIDIKKRYSKLKLEVLMKKKLYVKV